jgi:hypothetical protein
LEIDATRSLGPSAKLDYGCVLSVTRCCVVFELDFDFEIGGLQRELGVAFLEVDAHTDVPLPAVDIGNDHTCELLASELAAYDLHDDACIGHG